MRVQISIVMLNIIKFIRHTEKYFCTVEWSAMNTSLYEYLNSDESTGDGFKIVIFDETKGLFERFPRHYM